MKIATISLLALIFPASASAYAHNCSSIAQNERLEATDIRCVNADVYVIGGREQLSKNGRKFKLYRMECVVTQEERNHLTTDYFRCKAGGRYVDFSWVG
jgi:hypothetical protein